ncbi:MAG: hypothetical protein K6A76_08475 [Oribacterium sp.]|nr:hypothetical protein [Oribacterium sp.]
MRILKYIFLVMCIVPLTLMFLRMGEYQKEENTYNEIKRVVAEQRIRDGQKAVPKWINPNDLIDFSGLLDKNRETVGYIRIDGTKIDYPVVRTEKYTESHKLIKYIIKNTVYLYDTVCFLRQVG